MLGQHDGCVIAAGGALWCGGWNPFGFIGVPAAAGTDPHSAVQMVTGGRSFVQLDVAEEYRCGLEADGGAWCWGRAIPVGPAGAQSTVPIRVAEGHAFTSISTGELHTCALKADGSAWCWGSNLYGELGRSTTAAEYGTPQRVPEPGERWAHITATLGSTCGITLSGKLYCWGDGY